MSEYLSKEISGAYFSKEGSDKTTHMTLGQYSNNTSTKVNSGTGQLEAYTLKTGLKPKHLIAFFHTHPLQSGYSYIDRSNASQADKDGRDSDLQSNPNMNFYILTRPYGYSSSYEKIKYTTTK